MFTPSYNFLGILLNGSTFIGHEDFYLEDDEIENWQHTSSRRSEFFLPTKSNSQPYFSIDIIESAEISICKEPSNSTVTQSSLSHLQRKIVQNELKFKEQKFELEIKGLKIAQDIQEQMLLVELQHKKRLLEMAEEEHRKKIRKY